MLLIEYHTRRLPLILLATVIFAQLLDAQGDTHDSSIPGYNSPPVQGALLTGPLGEPSSLNQLQVPVVPPTPTATTTTQGSPTNEPTVTGTPITTTSPTATETAHSTTSTTTNAHGTTTPSATHGPTSDACMLKSVFGVYSIIYVSIFLFMYAIV
ncbi:hypothetical protein O0I10_006707 [Lichtheimia ornata]|uniref:Uncharacterized protein n=1 Tax=Lichtheimia ornata TaxID=688661 RepID=A0AAD7V4T2_9FUNG|nr:uncharacterized protein O0I10_006707 [Lichtheimia ornata]KAJ8657641.1 hypothetical protein O0I10_006707 [Lichtheimia ornata]